MSNNLPEEPGLALTPVLMTAVILRGTLPNRNPRIPESQNAWDS